MGMHLQAPSVVTDQVSTTADHAHPVVLTTPSLLSDSVAKVDVTTTWSRTPGVADGEPVVTSKWPVTWETTAVLPANLLSQWPPKRDQRKRTSGSEINLKKWKEYNENCINNKLFMKDLYL